MIEDPAAPAAGQGPEARSDAEQPGGGRRARKRRKRLSPLTVMGELFIVAGLSVVGYLGWQHWNTEVVVRDKQIELSAQDSERWRAAAEADPTPWDGVVPVVPTVAPAEVFGVLYVPAFSPTYANRVAATTDWWSVLNLDEKGIGHYENTQMPGEPGNVALAGHRSGPLINSFREVMNLRLGDALFLETQEGWYVYRFRSIEYVLPTEVDVLSPFPRITGTPGADQILTLTTCHPKEAGSDERAIVYAVFESYQPLSEGPPAELLALNPTMEAHQAPRGDAS